MESVFRWQLFLAGIADGMAGIATTRILGVLLRVLQENRLLAGFAWVLHCFSQFLPQNLPFEIAVRWQAGVNERIDVFETVKGLSDQLNLASFVEWSVKILVYFGRYTLSMCWFTGFSLILFLKRYPRYESPLKIHTYVRILAISTGSWNDLHSRTGRNLG